MFVGRGCCSLRSLPRNNEASLSSVESRIQERVMDTGSLDTKTRSEAFGMKATTVGRGNPVLQVSGIKSHLVVTKRYGTDCRFGNFYRSSHRPSENQPCDSQGVILRRFRMLNAEQELY